MIGLTAQTSNYMAAATIQIAIMTIIIATGMRQELTAFIITAHGEPITITTDRAITHGIVTSTIHSFMIPGIIGQVFRFG